MNITMKNLKEIKEILEALGWERVESKNTCMVSYLKEEERLNYYFTTGTTTFQTIGEYGVKPEKYTEVNTAEQMEKILCTRPDKI